MEKATRTGRLGEIHFMEYATEQGWDVFIGFGNTRCDLIADRGTDIIRVEVKCSLSENAGWGGTRNQSYCFAGINTEKFDYLFLSVPGYWYFIPRNSVIVKGANKARPDRGGVIRVTSPKRYDGCHQVTREYGSFIVRGLDDT